MIEENAEGGVEADDDGDVIAPAKVKLKEALAWVSTRNLANAYPVSFVGLFDVSANPAFFGTAGSAFNFIPSGLTGYSLSPSNSYGGGVATFQMNNLNHKEFAVAMHRPLDEALIEYFTAWLGNRPRSRGSGAHSADRAIASLIREYPAFGRATTQENRSANTRAGPVFRR